MSVDPKWEALTQWQAEIVCLEWRLLSGPACFIARVKDDPYCYSSTMYEYRYRTFVVP